MHRKHVNQTIAIQIMIEKDKRENFHKALFHCFYFESANQTEHQLFYLDYQYFCFWMCQP